MRGLSIFVVIAFLQVLTVAGVSPSHFLVSCLTLPLPSSLPTILSFAGTQGDSITGAAAYHLSLHRVSLIFVPLQALRRASPAWPNTSHLLGQRYCPGIAFRPIGARESTLQPWPSPRK